MWMKDTDLLIENNVQPIPVFQKKLEDNSKLAEVFILVRMNSVLYVRYFLYDLLGIVKNLAQKV